MKAQRGVTLIEVCIAIAIMALAAAVVIPGINSFSRADLRRAASGLSGVVRQTYDSAALGGKTFRLAFAPGKALVRIESTEQALSFEGRGGALVAAASAESLAAADADLGGSSTGAAAAPPPEPDADAEPSAGGGAVAALFGINKLASANMQAGFEKVGTYTLPGSVEVLGVWTDGMEAASTEGEIYLTFFPSGYTQEALVHLQDADKRVYTVKVSALTGRAEVLDHYVEVQK